MVDMHQYLRRQAGCNSRRSGQLVVSLAVCLDMKPVYIVTGTPATAFAKTHQRSAWRYAGGSGRSGAGHACIFDAPMDQQNWSIWIIGNTYRQVHCARREHPLCASRVPDFGSNREISDPHGRIQGSGWCSFGTDGWCYHGSPGRRKVRKRSSNWSCSSTGRNRRC